VILKERSLLKEKESKFKPKLIIKEITREVKKFSNLEKGLCISEHQKFT
jgi:hypothetical protein